MQKISPRRAGEDADLKEDDRKYRLRQFYAILLRADKARLLSFRESERTDKGASGKPG